jgi:hypothetical protein
LRREWRPFRHGNVMSMMIGWPFRDGSSRV